MYLFMFRKKRMQRASRLKRELQMLSTEPPPGITCWQTEDRIDDLRAQIVGGTGTPYEGGVFSLEVKIPERYPFEPPKMRFLTPIYHPNIDTSGRICHDALKLPPKGAWKPSLNISTVLTSIQLLMAEPNPDDPLMADISSEFKYNKHVFVEKARRWTQEHAVQKNTGVSENDKENTPDQKVPPKRDAVSQQETDKPAKRPCV
uniref:Ubiquitin-conjugating enzyme E2 T n=2 Tax=Nothobranchius TaxID=28779 RepID=A0A1A8MPG7_9TELE